MKKLKIGNESVRIVVSLSVIALVAALLLAAVNLFTQVNEKEELQKAIAENYSSPIAEEISTDGYVGLNGTELQAAYRAEDGAYIFLIHVSKANRVGYSADGVGVITVIKDGVIYGSIDILDTRYGSLWTNISDTMVSEAGISYGDSVIVTISYKGRVVYSYPLTLCRNFTEVSMGEALVYINSLLNIGVALNQGSFASAYHIGTGEGWLITLKKN